MVTMEQGYPIGLCKTDETKDLQKRQALPARPPPNKSVDAAPDDAFEGATLYSIKNAKLNNISGRRLER